jgi:hypothetical protein
MVAEQAEAQAVAQQGPQVVLGSVEEVLDDAMGRLGRALDSLGRAVEVDAGAEEVDRNRADDVGDREGPAVELDRLGARGREAAEAELLKQRVQPALAGQADGGVVGGELVEGGAKGPPAAEQAQPGAADSLTEGFVLGEVVGGRFDIGEGAVEGGDTLEQLVREESALATNCREGELGRASHAAPPWAGSRTNTPRASGR